VRRAVLCGLDRLTGKSYEHRKGGIVDRLRVLGEVFCIDVCAYAVMANHHHVVLRLNPEQAAALSDEAVVERWSRLFSLPLLVERYRQGLSASDVEVETAREWIATYRERLADLSWFMRCLNEPIARWANAEDGCTGRFWEGRFKSQALLDEPALLSCMAYVDLNPIRAGMAETPEMSDFTSGQQRIQALSESVPQNGREKPRNLAETIPELLGFASNDHDDSGLPFTLDDYLELMDWSGRAIHPNKRGKIPEKIPPILERLGINPDRLLRYLNRKERGFYLVIGTPTAFQQAVANLGRRFFKGISAANRLFAPQLR
jgi:REP element-mobilizing transposase RayT